MGKDLRTFVLLGVGVVAAAWAVTYAGAVQELVGTGTNGYVTMIRGLEPPSIGGGGGIAGGAGNFTPNVGLTSSGSPFYGTSPVG